MARRSPTGTTMLMFNVRLELIYKFYMTIFKAIYLCEWILLRYYTIWCLLSMSNYYSLIKPILYGERRKFFGNTTQKTIRIISINIIAIAQLRHRKEN